MTDINIIFCNHPLYPRKVDYDYEEEYEKYNMLPGWYDDFKDYTAKSVWEDKKV